MNHVLQYTQLNFKFDPLLKPEILGLIPSGVINLWTLSQSTDRCDSRLKKNGEKKVVFEFSNSLSLMHLAMVRASHLALAIQGDP